jgi:hypothetical protein
VEHPFLKHSRRNIAHCIKPNQTASLFLQHSFVPFKQKAPLHFPQQPLLVEVSLQGQ